MRCYASVFCLYIICNICTYNICHLLYMISCNIITPTIDTVVVQSEVS